jgi:hypothetical protein
LPPSHPELWTRYTLSNIVKRALRDLRNSNNKEDVENAINKASSESKSKI